MMLKLKNLCVPQSSIPPLINRGLPIKLDHKIDFDRRYHYC